MPRSHFSQSRRCGGFSLLELITVLAILSILSAIGGGVFFSRQKELKKDRARADMQVIQQGLEAYRARFGDYPRLPDGVGAPKAEVYLLNALNGQYGPAHEVISGQGIASMLNNSLLEMGNPSAGLPLSAVKENWIVDPWGNPYEYDDEPKNADDKVLFGYSLRSAGPDGDIETTEDNLEAK